MKYFSTFTGIGGFEVGIGKAYETISSIENAKQGNQRIGNPEGQHSERANLSLHGLSCVGYSEVNKYATQIYQSHFPEHKNYGDITKIVAEDLPDFDLLVGGFPCQSFSIAGKRGGFEDVRGTLFFDLARILQAKQPRQFLFENVKGLLSHDNGTTFAVIIQTLDELGYDLQWQVLNSKDFGVPQNRERIFIIGHLRGTSRPEVFPFYPSDQEDSELSGEQVINTLTTRYGTSNGSGAYVAERTINAQEQPVTGTYRTHKSGQGFRESKSGLVPTIPARGREDGSGQPVIVQTPRGKNAGGEHDIAPTVSASSFQDNNHVLYNALIRRLTPLECERLQGFPDGWTGGVSDSQRYKCIGNAVTVNVIKAICEKLLQY